MYRQMTVPRARSHRFPRSNDAFSRAEVAGRGRSVVCVSVSLDQVGPPAVRDEPVVLHAADHNAGGVEGHPVELAADLE